MQQVLLYICQCDFASSPNPETTLMAPFLTETYMSQPRTIPKLPVIYWFRNNLLSYSRVKVCKMKNIQTKSLKFSGFLDSQEFLENSREISLLNLDLEAFSFHFSFSISILSHFHFTFHSRSRSQGFFISLFILEMSEPDFHFTFHFSDKVKEINLSLFTSRKE